MIAIPTPFLSSCITVFALTCALLNKKIIMPSFSPLFYLLSIFHTHFSFLFSLLSENCFAANGHLRQWREVKREKKKPRATKMKLSHVNVVSDKYKTKAAEIWFQFTSLKVTIRRNVFCSGAPLISFTVCVCFFPCNSRRKKKKEKTYTQIRFSCREKSWLHIIRSAGRPRAKKWKKLVFIYFSFN